MHTEILKENNVVIWRPDTELEDPSHLQGAMEEFKSSGMHSVLLDLMEKEWLSSSEIGVVMWVFKELDGMGSKLSLLAASPFVMKTIQVTGIDQLLSVFDSREAALSSLEA
jgi:anti-sigma B factor antagonist